MVESATNAPWAKFLTFVSIPINLFVLRFELLLVMQLYGETMQVVNDTRAPNLPTPNFSWTAPGGGQKTVRQGTCLRSSICSKVPCPIFLTRFNAPVSSMARSML